MISNVLLLVIMLFFGLNVGNVSVKGQSVEQEKIVGNKKGVESKIPKIGYVDMSEILKKSPNIKKIDANMRDYQQQMERKLQQKGENMQKEIENMNKILESLTGEEQKQKQEQFRAKVNELYREVQASERNMEYDIQRKHAELLAPILKQISSVIHEIAQSEAYDFIFNKGEEHMPMIYYANPVFDITEKVYNKVIKLPMPEEVPTAVEKPKVADNKRIPEKRTVSNKKEEKKK